VTQNTYRTTDPVYGSNGAAILAGDRAVILIPKTQLVSGAYNVRITQPGVPDVAWSFNVDRDPGLVLTADVIKAQGRDLKLPVLDSKLRWIVFSIARPEPGHPYDAYDWRGSTVELTPVGQHGACPARKTYRRCKAGVRIAWPGSTVTGEDGRDHVLMGAHFSLRDAVSGFTCPVPQSPCDVLRVGTYRLTLTLRGEPIPGGKPVSVAYTRTVRVDAS
jgi:hypothetical protein